MKFDKIFYWLLALFVLYLIIEVIKKILGSGLSYETLAVGLLIANIGYTIALHSKISNINSKLSGHIGWHKGRKERE